MRGVRITEVPQGFAVGFLVVAIVVVVWLVVLVRRK
jgi:hypothetical protein